MHQANRIAWPDEFADFDSASGSDEDLPEDGDDDCVSHTTSREALPASLANHSVHTEDFAQEDFSYWEARRGVSSVPDGVRSGVALGRHEVVISGARMEYQSGARVK